MKTVRFHLITIFILFFAVACSTASHSAKATPSHENMAFPADTSSAELKRIKALAGTWKSTTSMFGKENEEVFTEYKVTAGGSAVIETIFPGTPHEMVSVYYDDNDGKLAMTHYCMLRNRPQFTLVESSKDHMKFDVSRVDGQTSKETPSMGATTLTFKDKDHYSSTCESDEKSGQKDESMTMNFTRIH